MKSFIQILFFISISLSSFSQTSIIEVKETTNKIKELTFIDFENNTIRIDTNNSKCSVINIWATWCKPCVAEIPTFNKLKQDYNGCNVDFYAISYKTDSSNVIKFLAKQPYDFKQLLTTGEYLKALNLLNGLPTTLFIDKKGNILYKMVGGQIEAEMQYKTVEEFKIGMDKIGCH